MNRAALKRNDSASERVLYMAMELSHKHWKLVFGDGMKRRQVTIEAEHRMELGEAIRKAKERFGLHQDAHTVSCYEAGRDGFWVHRYLVSVGIENQVLPLRLSHRQLTEVFCDAMTEISHIVRSGGTVLDDGR
ncbi:MAG: hypothetical protein ACREX4_09180, partial [Gammaproteobacteria bacterium]